MRNRDMQMVSEVIGPEATLKLMTELGGMYFYIPKPSPEDIETLLEEHGNDAKEVARLARVSLSKVYKVMKEVNDRKKVERFEALQMPLFPENDN